MGVPELEATVRVQTAHKHRAMRPATGRLIKRPDRRFVAAAMGAIAINAAVAIGAGWEEVVLEHLGFARDYKT